MPSRFHEAALRMLSLVYVPDPAALDALQKRETALGVRLPASFVELFGMKDGIAVLRRNSNCDVPIEIDQLGRALEWRWRSPRNCVDEGLLPFMFENQAVAVWAVELRGGDDPPVLVARDPELEWRPCAETFSTFVACQVWDHTAIFRVDVGGRALLQAQDNPLRAADLALLRGRFSERTSTRGWPGDHQWRFESPEGCLLLWDTPDQTDWWVASDDEDRLLELTKKIWNLGDLRSSLSSLDDRGRRVLERLRA